LAGKQAVSAIGVTSFFSHIATAARPIVQPQAGHG